MAKNKGSSDYSTGNGKKWSIFLAIIVLVAIVVVVIILAISPNTYNAVETLNRTSQTTFLTVENDSIQYNKFKTKINASVVNAYTTELYDIESLTLAIDEILDYHNDYLAFAKNNKVFKKNYKEIKNSLNDSKNSQKELVKIIEKTNKLSDESSTYLQSAMIDFRKEYKSWLKFSKKAINALENVYTGSLGNITFNNPASSLILNTANDYLDVIVQDFSSLVDSDVKGANITTYQIKFNNLGLHSKITYFTSFVSRYINSTEVDGYYFDSAVQEKYATLNSFFELYSQSNLVEIIDSINNSGEITKTYEGITDENGVYNSICNFLKGGM